VQGGVYCRECDAIDEPGERLHAAAAAVFWALFVAFIVAALSAAVWGPW
jgi:hypothetical protein